MRWYLRHTTLFPPAPSQVTPLGDIISHVLPPGAPPPPWDTRGEYRADNVEIFFLSNACKPTPLDAAWGYVCGDEPGAGGGGSGAGAGASAVVRAGVTASSSRSVVTAADVEEGDPMQPQIEWSKSSLVVRIPPAAPLMLPLVHPSYITADIPTFFVVARSSATYGDMRARCGGRFPEIAVPDLPPPPTAAGGAGT